jgi:hypothetical protein
MLLVANFLMSFMLMTQLRQHKFTVEEESGAPLLLDSSATKEAFSTIIQIKELSSDIKFLDYSVLSYG